jgi:hypothetical protein
VRTQPTKISRIHYAVPTPRAYMALYALHMAHKAVEREDRGDSAGILEVYAASHMAGAARASNAPREWNRAR